MILLKGKWAFYCPLKKSEREFSHLYGPVLSFLEQLFLVFVGLFSIYNRYWQVKYVIVYIFLWRPKQLKFSSQRVTFSFNSTKSFHVNNVHKWHPSNLKKQCFAPLKKTTTLSRWTWKTDMKSLIVHLRDSFNFQVYKFTFFFVRASTTTRWKRVIFSGGPFLFMGRIIRNIYLPSKRRAAPTKQDWFGIKY